MSWSRWIWWISGTDYCENLKYIEQNKENIEKILNDEDFKNENIKAQIKALEPLLKSSFGNNVNK